MVKLHSILITIKFLCFCGFGVLFVCFYVSFHSMSENFLYESTYRRCQVLGIHYSLAAGDQMILFYMKLQSRATEQSLNMGELSTDTHCHGICIKVYITVRSNKYYR